MKKRVVIFLDLLGFESFSIKDSDAALRILEDFQEVLLMRRQTANLNLSIDVPELLMDQLPDRTSLDSFEYFLPMSDSVFILSDEPENVAVHLSTFLVESLFCGVIPLETQISPTSIRRESRIFAELTPGKWKRTPLTKTGIPYFSEAGYRTETLKCSKLSRSIAARRSGFEM